ncbi:MAG: type II toxin-antitoxin system VapC family toxin [Nanoarchaeota archaeon]
MKLFYIDTSIWIDLYEDRTGKNLEPFGEYASRLFTLIMREKHEIGFSDILLTELGQFYSIEVVRGMVAPFNNLMRRIKSTDAQKKEAGTIAHERGIPKGDVLHAILSRDHQLILVTRDHHFRRLTDISPSFRPEELI